MIKQTQSWQTWTGRMGAFLCLLLFLVIIDALVSRFREPPNFFSGLPGDRLAVSGPLAEKVEQIGELTYQIKSEDIQLEFKSIQTGYWLGGYLWNGYLNLSPNALPGDYQLTVRPKNSPPEKPSSRLQIRVYQNLSELRQNSKSYLKRSLGLAAWQAGLFLLVSIAIVFGLVYYLSQKTENLLAAQGKAEVYRIRKGETGFQVFFGLGSRQGIRAGNSLTLIDHQGRIVGSITVGEVFENYSTALAEPELNVQPGFIIARSP